MDNEPYREITHSQAADMLADEARINGYHAFREFKLPNGKIADVLVRDSRYLISIFEVKTRFEPRLLDEAEAKYGQWCNRLIFAVPDLDAATVAVHVTNPCDFPRSQRLGICGIYLQGNHLFRPPQQVPMWHERVTTLARLIADRLSAGEAGFL